MNDHIPTPNDIDIHDVLRNRRQVAVIWSIEDVHSIRPDLSNDQAWEVLQQCRKVHDCEVGFTWLLIETVARDLFPANVARAEANARLLAAAPELLRAVEDVLIASEDGGDMNDIDWNLLRAAVAKATTTPTSARFDADEEPSIEIPPHRHEGDGQ